MKIVPTKIPDVLIVEPTVFRDERGYLLESWNEVAFAEHGISESFVQDCHSHSTRNVLRGLHYQLENPQGKLVRVVRGAVLDVAVDIRWGSPHFGDWVSNELSADNQRACYIPPGFAHGFCVLSDSADSLYKCAALYAPEDEFGVIWNDPDVGIDWPSRDFIVSKKDSILGSLSSMSDRLPAYEKVP